MKKVFKKDELAHIWASQSQESGRYQGGNFYFEGEKIYSYGRHFCIARILEGNRVLVTNRKYSNTTSSHVYSVLSAVKHMEVLRVAYPESFFDSLHNFEKTITDLICFGSNPRKKEHTKASAKQLLKDVSLDIEKYFSWLGKDLKKHSSKEFFKLYQAAKYESKLIVLSEKFKIEAEKKERKRKKELAERVKKQTELLNLWLSGENIDTWDLRDIEKVYLRYVDRFESHELETSKGARVEIKEAKKLFELIKRKIDIKGHRIGSYTVISLNGVLKIGCHEIERSEINRFADLMNWGRIEDTH